MSIDSVIWAAGGLLPEGIISYPINARAARVW